MNANTAITIISDLIDRINHDGNNPELAHEALTHLAHLNLNEPVNATIKTLTHNRPTHHHAAGAALYTQKLANKHPNDPHLQLAEGLLWALAAQLTLTQP